MRHWKRWVFVVFGIVLLAAAGFVMWASTPAAPLPQAVSAMESDSLVRVQTAEYITFEPVGAEFNTGLIMYPGGRVDPRSYAPLARSISQRGFLVVIVPMPLNLAVFNPSAAAGVITKYPQVEHWAVGGHSLGGAMAAQFAAEQGVQFDGLVLWAAYPSESSDLSDSTLPVLSIYGTLDGLSTIDKIEASRSLLPADTVWAAIDGGNHAQFGWYGLQAGDNPASLSQEEQQTQIVDATAGFLATLQGDSAAN